MCLYDNHATASFTREPDAFGIEAPEAGGRRKSIVCIRLCPLQSNPSIISIYIYIHINIPIHIHIHIHVIHTYIYIYIYVYR